MCPCLDYEIVESQLYGFRELRTVCRGDSSAVMIHTNTTCSSSLTPYSNEATTSTKHRREVYNADVNTPN